VAWEALVERQRWRARRRLLCADLGAIHMEEEEEEEEEEETDRA
jgi:hypothetical protein